MKKTRLLTLFLTFSFLLVNGIGMENISAKNDFNVVREGINTYSEISSGYRHVCALNALDELMCWGSNIYGQIGGDSYTFIGRSTPGSVPGLGNETISTFKAGGFNTCIINGDGALKCWGGNNYRELGNPEMPWWASGTPLQVLGMETGVTDVAIGQLFICSLKEGNAYCWGYDYTYANSGEDHFDRPQLVESDYSFNSIFANAGTVCGITTDAEVACWGLGFGATPTIINGLGNAVSVAVLESNVCALTAGTETSSAKVMCSGVEGNEVMGLLGTPVALTAGRQHACAIVEEDGLNSVMCWGRNHEGQLGIGSTIDTYTPTKVIGSTGAVKISAGESHTTVIMDTGLVRSWGGNSEGQLGNGALVRRQLPIHLQKLSQPLVNVVSGEYHTCGLTKTGGVWCWGGNEYGQVGNGETNYVPYPVEVISSNVIGVFAGPFHTCALLDSNEVMCWGHGVDSTSSHYPKLVVYENDLPLDDVVDIGCGNGYNCALLRNGMVKCWGYNSHGELGVPGIPYSTTPVAVQSLPGPAVTLAVGLVHNCVTTNEMDAYCWGVNYNGNLGMGSSDFEPHTTPVKVINLESNLVDISAGHSKTCVLTSLGSVSCWGGNGAAHTPYKVDGLEQGVDSISTGGSLLYFGDFACALMEDTRAVKCWGNNNYGQLGDGTYESFGSYTPVDVLGLAGNVTSIQAGAVSSCALFESGAAACWGSDYQLETSPVDLIEVNELDLPPSIFFSNYYEGGPESYFVITGLYYSPDKFMDILINGVLKGQIKTNETGVFKFFTYFDEIGTYEVSVLPSQNKTLKLSNASSSSSNRTVGEDKLTINITKDNYLRMKEGDGYTIGSIQFSVYLPLLLK